jgi:DNA-3-methyladenine glycosylase
MKTINPANLSDVRAGAKYLLGCEIVRTLEDGQTLSAKIVEVESYHQEDPASHTFGGQSSRNIAMFGPAAHAYIYFTYGMHWCFNVTAGPAGYGAGILIRAAQPLKGVEYMQQNRKLDDKTQLTNGPAKLAQALAIDKALYGHNLQKPPLQIFEPKQRDFKIIETTRIGISKAVDEIARFYIKDSPFVSKR